jgi:MoaA/NifB/PqqE/SkfB family radical SAM enzyme
MESIYYSITWACHRKCVHCYEDKFRPYVRDKLQAVVDETKAVFPRVVANLPERMTYLDLDRPKDGGGYQEGVERVILSGGEVLIDPIREPALYPLLEQLRDKYRSNGGANVVVQTTGDLVTEKIIDELLVRGVW